jgi:hypothetical protein
VERPDQIPLSKDRDVQEGNTENSQKLKYIDLHKCIGFGTLKSSKSKKETGCLETQTARRVVHPAE